MDAVRNFAAWIAQVLAALAVGAHEYTLLFRPEQAASRTLDDGRTRPILKRFIGMTEILGAIGAIVPAATGLCPW